MQQHVIGNQYSFEDLQVLIEGKGPLPLIGFQGLEYTSKKEHYNIKGKGNKTVSVARGAEDHEGTLTILQSELEAFQRTLTGGKSLTTKAPFTIIAAYAPGLDDGSIGVPTVDKLVACRITEVKKGMTNSDGYMTVELPLMIGDIKYNI